EYGGKIYSANCRFTGCGTAFKLTPPATVGGAWAEHVLYEFQGTGVGSNDGSNPLGGLVADATGALYGTTQGGGFAQVGTVFKLTPPATSGSRWTEGILHFFVTSSGDGISPFAGLVFSNHELYGTTQIGGSVGEHFGGTVFEVTP
ncbi:MAG: choice-of-anchor tandem repeat GloVer-containing protein, partial [Acidimicrobiales bacterium]